MSMHLEGPWMTTTGRRKGKQKFRNADQAKKSRELDRSWEELQKKWAVTADEKQRNRALTAPVWKPDARALHRTTPHVPSLNPQDMSNCVRTADKVYTGDQMLGITIVHKSCLQPVFNPQAAIDAANMRR